MSMSKGFSNVFRIPELRKKIFITLGLVFVCRLVSQVPTPGVDWTVSVDDSVSKVSAIGVGMQSASGVAGRFFGALAARNIAVLGTTTSEIKIAVLVPRDQGHAAVDALMTEFGLKDE